ncbi:hypothetical protein SETIT_4G207700v2 [Setaria italica]|uniref:Uncharacterized protein n=1 Tax=Setaria italica TaxID=4555 RepID=A0A368QWK7_SETIT|nr:hypothetical protein SETIT_4G207700v2 [Setaria italica]
MQPLNCISFLLGLAILSATLGPFVTIAHRELLMVTSSKSGAEIKLELSVDKTSTHEEVRSNVLTGRKLAFGDTAMKQKDAQNSGSKTSSGEIKNYSTNSSAPSNLKGLKFSLRYPNILRGRRGTGEGAAARRRRCRARRTDGRRRRV